MEPSCLATLSPGSFSLPPPVIIGKNIIPPAALRAMSRVWDRGNFTPLPLRILELRNVYLVGQGVVISEKGEFISETVSRHKEKQLSQAFANWSQYRHQATQVTGRNVLARKPGDQNYGHWLVECVSKPHFCRRTGVDFDGIVVPENGGAMRKIMDDSLELLDLARLKIIKAPTEIPTFHESLIFVEGLTVHGPFMSPLALNHLENMRESQPGAGIKRVFIRRSAPVRRLSNEREIRALLSSQGFLSIDPSQFSLREQIALLKDADVVVGVMGAAMTNLVFSHCGGIVINLAPAVMPDTFFYFLAAHRRQRYVEIRCLVDDPAKDRNSDFRAAPEIVMRTLEAELGRNWAV